MSELRLSRRKRCRVGRIATVRMTKTACAVARAARGICYDVENDVIRSVQIAGNTADSLQMVQREIVPHPPRDEVIRARCVATDSDCAYYRLPPRIERQSATKNI